MFGINIDVTYTEPIAPTLNVTPTLNLSGLPDLE